MWLAQGPQPNDASEARTCCLSVSSQALYHWATALPADFLWKDKHPNDKETKEANMK